MQPFELTLKDGTKATAVTSYNEGNQYDWVKTSEKETAYFAKEWQLQLLKWSLVGENKSMSTVFWTKTELREAGLLN